MLSDIRFLGTINIPISIGTQLTSAYAYRFFHICVCSARLNPSKAIREIERF